MAAYDLQSLKARFDRSPFTHWLNLEPAKISEDGLEFAVSIRPEMLGNPVTGAVHGGVLASLIDIACSFSLIVRDAGNYVTVDLRTDFHRACKGGVLTVKGNVVRAGRRLSTTEARIEAADGLLIATGRGVFMAISPSGGEGGRKENSR